ncbi:MAG: pyridoxal phosphate-dependent aminotransferase [Gammaproteobacteria bacterium]|nr:pyridoxal phosphate-dependent aminotransferase [Gammaproteobacteria bacterium]
MKDELSGLSEPQLTKTYLDSPSTKLVDPSPHFEQLPISLAAHRLAAADNSAWKVHTDAMQRIAEGKSIIPLSIGDPDFNTPDYINVGLIEAIKRHRTHYTSPAGETRLKNELARLETRTSGYTRHPNQFTVFHGATGAIHATLSCIANPGDNVVTAEPKYIGYEPTCATIGVDLKTVPMDPPGFTVDVDALINAVDQRTVGMIINTPSNPMGNVTPAYDLKRLADECRIRNLWLISDEVYSLLCFEQKHVSVLNVVENLENVVVVDSLSKSHAMSGWRVGWTVSSPEFSERLADYALGAFFCGSPFIQDGATYALKHNTERVQKMVEQYKLRRDYTLDRVQAVEGLSAERPAGGMFVMVNVHEDGDQFARRLLDEAGVSVFPGSACGEGTRNFVRVGLAKPISELEEAWNRIESWLNNRERIEP